MRTSTSRFAVLVALSSLLSAASAAEPKAAIDGPATRKPGQSAILDARKSVSDRPLKWKAISPPGMPVLTFDQDGRTAVFAFLPDLEPGEYLLALVAVGDVGGQPEADVAIHRVLVGGPAPGPGPGPGPTPPDPGPPPSDLAAYVRDVVARAVPAADRKAGALSIAAAYREAVRLGRDGKFPNPQTMVTFVREEMKTARPASWVGFVLEPKFKELQAAGKLATTADLARVFEEIALTLEAIADGK